VEHVARREMKKIELQNKMGSDGTSIVSVMTGDMFQKVHEMRSVHRRNNSHGAALIMKKLEFDLHERKGADRLQNNGITLGF
jgi:hypothetical protein